MKLALLTLLLILLPFSSARACMIIPSNEEQLSKAEFIGVLKIIDSKRESPKPVPQGHALPEPLDYIFTVQPIQSYKNPRIENFEVHMSSAVCGGYSSHLIEVALYKSANGELFLPFPDEFRNLTAQFEKYRNETKKSDALIAEEKACKEQGKKLVYKNTNVICE